MGLAGHEMKGATRVLVVCRSRLVAEAIYALVALMWLIPDPRIERAVRSERRDN